MTARDATRFICESEGEGAISEKTVQWRWHKVQHALGNYFDEKKVDERLFFDNFDKFEESLYKEI